MELVVAAVDGLRIELAAAFQALASRGPVACAISGGGAALIFLPALRESQADWSRVSLFWTDERATLAYDLWVLAILAFVWLTPPDWLNDPTAAGLGWLGSLWSAR